MHDERHPHHHESVFESRWVTKLAIAFLVVATIFVGAKAVNALMNFDTIAAPPTNVVSVTGEGKVSAVPDIASISFTVSEDANTSAQAQDAATKKMNTALKLLEGLGIDDKDVKTSSYVISPRYSNQQPCYPDRPCVYGEQKIIGYSASQTVEVKVREIDNAGKVLSALGEAGAQNLYGPNFTIDDPEELKTEARKQAIEEARAHAKQLASDLGVRIVRVVNYSENGGYPPMPYYYKGVENAVGSAAPARDGVTLPAGENEIVVSVSITYEIR